MFRGFLILVTLKYASSIPESKMSGHILGGQPTSINEHPHAVFLDINSKISCVCGGSILNQNIVLSAAHCLEDYRGRRKDSVVIKYGSASVIRSSQVRMRYYKMHDKYQEFTMYADIALLVCDTPIKLGDSVKRVAIMLNPPMVTLARVSGWGVVDKKRQFAKSLMYAKQNLRGQLTCQKYMHLPAGSFCAGIVDKGGYPYRGDSGAALIIKGFIQIGIVSFKEDTSLVAYTNVSYYYDWIKRNAALIYCA